MPRRIVVLFLLATAGLTSYAQSSGGRAAGSDNTEQLIVSLEKKTWELLQKKDASGFAALMADDAQDVGELGVWDKDKVVRSLAEPGYTLSSFSIDHLKFTKIAPTVALLTYDISLTGSSDGKPLPSPEYISSVWVNRKGKWLNVLFQDSPAEAPPAPVEKPTASRAEETAEAKLVRLEKQWAAALGDSAFLDSITADDYVIVDASGEVRNKRQELALSQKEKFSTSTADDLSVRVYGDTAVVLGRYTLGGTVEGEPYNESGRYTDVWVNCRGKWLLVSSQNTSLPVAASPEPPPDSFFIDQERLDWEALKHKNKAAAASLLADDFVGMGDFGFVNKTEWLKQIDDEYTVDDYKIMDPRVVHPSPNTALLLYTSTCRGTGTWADFCSHTMRISDLMVERNGQWFDLFSQDTRATEGDPDDASVLKEILASEYRIVDRLSHDDIEGFAKLLPEDVIDIDDDGVHTKAQWIPGFFEQKNRGYLFRDFRFDDPKLIRLGPDQATLAAKEIIRGLDTGKPFEWRSYTNATYVRRDGKWVPRVYQDTPMVK